MTAEFLKEYKYRLSSVFNLIFGFTFLFFTASLLFSWKISPKGFLVLIFSFTIGPFILINGNRLRHIRTFEDRVDFPKGFWSTVSLSIPYIDIISVQEQRGSYGYHLTIKTRQGTYKIPESMMKRKDYEELAHVLHNKSSRHTKVS